MRKHYVVLFPRDFMNEYFVFAVPADREEELKEVLQAACPLGEVERVTRESAYWLGFTRPNLAEKNGEQWAGGWANSPAQLDPLATREEIVTGALEKAVYLMDQAEK